MLPLKGIALFNFVVRSISVFLYISFIKCKYLSLVFSSFSVCKPLMKSKGKSAYSRVTNARKEAYFIG